MASMSGMSGMSSTATASAAASTSTAMSMGGMDMGGMDMGGGGNSCKISMLWNWYTIDSCFLASSWHVRSNGAFAGSCIGVILLVLVLEALRRGAKEYDAYLIRSRAFQTSPAATDSNTSDTNSNSNSKDPIVQTTIVRPKGSRSFTPNIFEQLIRALFHMLQFAVAYFIMLLAMYYNGYIIICIFIGAFLGSFIFSWQSIGLPGDDREITYCCG